MGYRSDVAYTIVFRNKQVLNEYIALVMVQGGKLSEALSQCNIEADDEDVCRINFYADQWKWYEGDFPIVDAHLDLLAFAVKRFGKDAAYRFVRVGEEVEDIDLRDGSEDAHDLIDWDLDVIRSIDTPFKSDYEPIGDKLALIP